MEALSEEVKMLPARILAVSGSRIAGGDSAADFDRRFAALVSCGRPGQKDAPDFETAPGSFRRVAGHARPTVVPGEDVADLSRPPAVSRGAGRKGTARRQKHGQKNQTNQGRATRPVG